MNWSKEVLGDSASARAEAKSLSATISKNDRLTRLAGNPLLLTTLLLVKRWVGGPFPTKRTILYEKAIEVLLMTWNVQGHEPLDLDETLPQLEYLAFVMLSEGKQAVSAKKLQEIITAARKEMPELLSWTKVGVNELIRRVELRSSLVMQSGHLAEGHRILPSYEFRHLTFQEYLAACAIVHGHLPRGTDADLVAVLRPYLDNVEWKEVVPLAAVMAGRKSQALLQELIERTSRHLKEQPRPRGRIVREKKTRPGEVLASCLVDEVQATPELVQAATTLLIHDSIFPIQLAGIREGKYGPMLLEAARTEFLRSKDDLLSIAGNMGVAYGWPHESTAFTKATSDRILSSCNDSDPIKQALACLNLMTITFTKHTQLTAPRKNPSKAAPTLSKRENLLVESWRGCLLGPRTSPHDGVKLAALWAEVWMVHLSRKPPAHASELAPDLISLWQSSDCIDLKYIASWLLASMPLIDRETIHLGSLTELDAFLKAKWFEPTLRFERAAAFAIAYYLRSPWDDQELANMLEDKANYETQGLSEYFDAFKKSFHAATR